MGRLEQAISDLNENIRLRGETPASLAGLYSHPVLQSPTNTHTTGILGDLVDTFSDNNQGLAIAVELEKHENNSTLLFGPRNIVKHLPFIYPDPLQRQAIWQSYLDNVAPLVTIVHRPSLEKLLEEVNEPGDTFDKADKTLVLAMYLSAIMSMTPAQCFEKLGEQQGSAIVRCRSAVEQALTEADLFNSCDFALLQGAVLYLITIRRYDEGHFVWTMIAVILRLAQRLELHRESSLSVTSPLNAEMSRRLWWHILALDVQCAEDHRTEPLIHNRQFDTRFPLNINDEDLVLGAKEFPCERSGYTNMTFSLIRFEVTATYRLLKYSSSIQSNSPAEGLLASRQQHVIGLEHRLCEKYLQYSNTKATVHWLCAAISWLVLAKLRVSVYDTVTSGDMPNTNLEAGIREFLFATSIDIIELSVILETSHRNLGNWNWMFKNNNQWQPLSLVLAELCLRPLGTDADRAWRAVDYAFPLWESQDACTQKEAWSIVSQLKERAIQARRQQLVISRMPAPALARQYSRSFPVLENEYLNNANNVRQSISTRSETPSCFPENSSHLHNSCPAWNPPDLSAVGLFEDPGSVSGMNTSFGGLPETLHFSHPGSFSDSILDFF